VDHDFADGFQPSLASAKHVRGMVDMGSLMEENTEEQSSGPQAPPSPTTNVPPYTDINSLMEVNVTEQYIERQADDSQSLHIDVCSLMGATDMGEYMAEQTSGFYAPSWLMGNARPYTEVGSLMVGSAPSGVESPNTCHSHNTQMFSWY
jgi:hypothetical protein